LDGVFLLTSEEKWMKAKALLQDEVLDLLDKDPENVPRKRMEQIRGFLMYTTRMYVGMTPYMIGFHMVIDSWRRGQDREGWQSKYEMYWLRKEEG
jgi:hypothetical protein